MSVSLTDFNVLLACFVIIAAVLDMVSFRIPNVLCGLVLVTFLAAAYISNDVTPLPHLYAGMGMLVLGIGLFYFNIMGGGDVKLLTVVALWLGLTNLGSLILATALIGGVLGGFLLIGRALLHRALPVASIPNLDAYPALKRNGPVPYGVAIALGTLYVMGWPIL
jgi:prepilin peptidase CpaA